MSTFSVRSGLNIEQCAEWVSCRANVMVQASCIALCGLWRYAFAEDLEHKNMAERIFSTLSAMRFKQDLNLRPSD